ncbi:MAG: SDR family oxidoreductase [Desulfobacterium sp.]|nr:SDR family oxidoreductase [Desulfobacterium sp.]MBU3947884.1 SDR family oxidoreductase [Pseudomonadota bacterium]MBU4009195.1 SDR family oxidoreductase [Pseudomonadota bacterium]MBU4034850.1 SDR family oxidoreductase [Pseudomonadota bacterium]
MEKEINKNKSLEFEEHVAFITGGGRGFGKAFGQALMKRGARIVLADIDSAAAEEAAAELRASGGEALPVKCDVADEIQVAAAIELAVSEYGGIDILINNAGLHSAAYAEPMSSSGINKLRRLFDVNVMGVIICSLAARQAMAGRVDSVIINISSSAAYDYPTAYGVSKLAVRGLTITMARDFKAYGIRVNAIAPGLIYTETIRKELPEWVLDTVKKQQILDREGDVKDIVEAMLYLASARSAFITGETLRVSGGFTLAI